MFLANKGHILIREVAKLLGIMVALYTGVKFGKLYYKLIEYEKIQSLKLNLRDYDAYMGLSDRDITDTNLSQTSVGYFTHRCIRACVGSGSESPLPQRSIEWQW